MTEQEARTFADALAFVSGVESYRGRNAIEDALVDLFPEARITFEHDRRALMSKATIYAGDQAVTIDLEGWWDPARWQQVAPFYKKHVERALIQKLGEAALAKAWGESAWPST
jgi:ParB-like chromosome segregation protein Spo0J